MIPSGIHTLAAADYHADPCEQPSLSAGIARILCTASPLHAWTAHPRLNPDHQPMVSEKFDVGTAAHALLLEGRSAVAVIDAADWRTNAAKDARDAARAAGQIPLLAKDWDAVQTMVESARVQLQGIDAQPPVLADGKPERVLTWEEGGVHCRARLDWLRDDFTAIDDYKTTTRSANPESWSRSLFGMGFDVQAAFYLRGLERVTGERAVWRWVVQEVSAPHALAVVGLGPDAMTLAQKKVDYAVATWRRCLMSGVWPGYPARVCWAELPGWEEAAWLAKELREEAAA